MQGEKSSSSVVKALSKIIKYEEKTGETISSVVICRGGGSFEDLNVLMMSL